MKVQLIDTPWGAMTRKQAAILSGLPLGTIIRRVWEGWPIEMLFCPSMRGARTMVPRPNRRVYASSARKRRNNPESQFVLPYAKFKAMKQRERESAKLQGDVR